KRNLVIAMPISTRSTIHQVQLTGRNSHTRISCFANGLMMVLNAIRSSFLNVPTANHQSGEAQKRHALARHNKSENQPWLRYALTGLMCRMNTLRDTATSRALIIVR